RSLEPKTKRRSKTTTKRPINKRVSRIKADQNPPQQLQTPNLIINTTSQVAEGERRGNSLDDHHGDHHLTWRLAHVTSVATRGSAHEPRAKKYVTDVEFDRPVRVRLVRECELVHAGLIQMLSKYANRVSILPPKTRQNKLADIALINPFTQRHKNISTT